ncbi:hypothetical protein SAMN04488023_11654 [Pedobacter rhizosphaerae]|uniref:Uncharacterized protein n=1 Tax=Pedobacter rhizosphaerae TaxID=390241 RepID=A0A1H9RZG0_9SPHI|nr:hypothetical protein SAMN04488023_11654 [Pedobacter rhizosphaerae]
MERKWLLITMLTYNADAVIYLSIFLIIVICPK